jgi:ABC-type branched-subunit amino acid transport system ATPase component
MSDELAIEASGLAKAYRDVHVLAGVDLRVPRGSVFALLGPNGAGNPVTELRRSFPPGAVAGSAGGVPRSGS